MRKKTLILFCFLLAFVSSRGQTTKYFLNQLEIAAQSVHFLNPDDIDSVKHNIQTSAADTSIVIYTTRLEKILTYNDVLNLYFLDKSARNLEVEFSTCDDIKESDKLVFSNDMIYSVRVENRTLRHLKVVNMNPRPHSYNRNKEAGRAMLALVHKFNTFKNRGK